jgi:hypothetical protein
LDWDNCPFGIKNTEAAFRSGFSLLGWGKGREEKRGKEEKASNACGMASNLWNCPPGGVLFWLSRPKKEPKKRALPTWPLAPSHKNLIQSGYSPSWSASKT